MRIGPLGTREIVATALLIVAVIAGISVTILRDDNSSQRDAAERLQPDAVPTATAPAAIPASVDQPTDWVLRYAEVSIADGSLLPGPVGPAKSLNLNFPAAPYADMRDNRWTVSVEANLSSDSEVWSFAIAYRGKIEVFIDGKSVAAGTSTERMVVMNLSLPHAPGTAPIRIEASDVEGPFMLVWQNGTSGS